VHGKTLPLLVEVAVGLGVPLVLFFVRLALVPWTGDRAPYAAIFIAVVAATVLAGWRSGLLALVVGQLLVWYFIVSPQWSFAIHDSHVRAGLIVATFSELVTLLTIGLYQREVDRGVKAREQRLELLDEALDEIDHRTRNNYATVLAMVELQARRAEDERVAGALRQVADRIQAIADASNRLARHSDGLDTIRLDDHLCGLVEQIGRGLAHDGIAFECDVDEVTANPAAATSISIIVNELVTNAIKHAFDGKERGFVQISGRKGREFELVVADNGRGMEATRNGGSGGLGTRLVDSFARQLKAKHEMVSSEVGTVHRLLIPSLD
jgi:two-component sensor histidine kinase